MSTIAFLTDQVAIGKILDHLGLSTPEAEKPPPAVPELLRVAEQGDGWGVPAQWRGAPKVTGFLALTPPRSWPPGPPRRGRLPLGDAAR